MRVLFVCTANISRSRVAEEVFRVLTWSLPGASRHAVRSAGTNPGPGGRAVSEVDVEWADLVCVMQPEHAAYITDRWAAAASKIRVLGVPDDYAPDDPVLHDLLTAHVRELLAGPSPFSAA